MRLGIVYYATGDKQITMAVMSAISAKRVMPDMPVKLYTSGSLPAEHPFDQVVTFPENQGSSRHKIEVLTEESAFDRYAFLDPDTLVLEDFTHVFEILDRFDLAGTHEPQRAGGEFGIPAAFDQIDPGVLFLKGGPETRHLLQTWAAAYTELEAACGISSEQKSLRKALYETQTHIWALPAEYNFRSDHPGSVGSGNPVYIVRGAQSMRAATRLNRSRRSRVFLGSWSQLTPFHFGFHDNRSMELFSFISKLLSLVRRR